MTRRGIPTVCRTLNFVKPSDNSYSYATLQKLTIGASFLPYL
jgi:hypothetical protein